jgi:hypothetical protein
LQHCYIILTKSFPITEISPGTAGRIPSFSITRRQDKSLQFIPPLGSLNSANTLAFKYPLGLDLESQLRRALTDHWESEHNMSLTTEQRHPDMYSPKTSPINDNEIPASHWETTTRKPRPVEENEVDIYQRQTQKSS